jgi:hypothetical protein
MASMATAQENNKMEWSKAGAIQHISLKAEFASSLEHG